MATPSSSTLFRFLPVVATGSMATLLELMVADPAHFWWWVYALTAVTVSASFLFANVTRRKIHRLKYLILPLLLLVGSVLFFVLLQTPLFRHLFNAVVALAYLVQFYNMLELHKDPLPERRKSILQFFDAVTAFTAFLLYVGLWQLTLFFGLPPWAALGSAALLTGILTYQLFWYHRRFRRRAILFVLVSALTAAELMWALLFWPTGYFVNGIVLLVAFYLGNVLALAHFRGTLTRRMLWKYGTLAAVVLATVLLTSGWRPPDYRSGEGNGRVVSQELAPHV